MIGLHDATLIARNIVNLLMPWCVKIKVAGSIRREEREVNDVEICCIPQGREVDVDLFGEPVVAREPRFGNAVDKIGRRIKGDAHTGLFIQRMLEDPEDESEIQIDIFCAKPENWGVILAIRTGPADFSHYTLAKRAHRYGLRIQGGMLTRDGEPIPIDTEEKLFKHLNLPMIQPKDRSQKKWLDGFC